MATRQALQPRKKPVQGRSTHTVVAICEACIQVLTDVGVERLTTTRVAERAGVSVGTLYQYFPHKHALLATVLERHLLLVVEATEQACRAHRGGTVAQIATALVDACLRAKFADAAASRALYAVAPAVGGDALVARLAQRGQTVLAEVLATAADRRFEDVATVSYMLSTTLIGPIQGLLTANAAPAVVEATRQHLCIMLEAYLAAAGVPRAAD